MTKFSLIPTELPDVLIVQPQVFSDTRGFFLETYNRAEFEAAGIDCEFVQDNHSRSARGALRGLHFQLSRPQGKLLRVIQGEVFDVVVDLRCESPTFGRWMALTLSATDQRQLWIPPGFAHGFCALRDDTDVSYKCTDYYTPDNERTLRWNDPAVGIEWPLSAPILSLKDQCGQTLAELFPAAARRRQMSAV